MSNKDKIMQKIVACAEPQINAINQASKLARETREHNAKIKALEKQQTDAFDFERAKEIELLKSVTLKAMQALESMEGKDPSQYDRSSNPINRYCADYVAEYLKGDKELAELSKKTIELGQQMAKMIKQVEARFEAVKAESIHEVDRELSDKCPNIEMDNAFERMEKVRPRLIQWIQGEGIPRLLQQLQDLKK